MCVNIINSLISIKFIKVYLKVFFYKDFKCSKITTRSLNIYSKSVKIKGGMILLDDKKLNPKNDIIFKALFCKKGNEDLLESLIESIINEKVVCKEIIKEARIGAKRPEEKYSTLDVKVILENDKELDIEIQLIDRKNTIPRAVYYMSLLTSEGLKPNENYKDMKPKVVIFLMNYSLFKYNEVISGSYICLENHKEHQLTDLQKYYFVDLTKLGLFKEEDQRKLKFWIAFLNQDKKELSKMKKDKIMRKAEKEFEYLTGDEEIKRLAELRQRAIRDEMASRQLGVKEGKLEIVKNMLLDNVKINQIMKYTGFTREEIEKIK